MSQGNYAYKGTQVFIARLRFPPGKSIPISLTCKFHFSENDRIS